MIRRLLAVLLVAAFGVRPVVAATWTEEGRRIERAAGDERNAIQPARGESQLPIFRPRAPHLDAVTLVKPPVLARPTRTAWLASRSPATVCGAVSRAGGVNTPRAPPARS